MSAAPLRVYVWPAGPGWGPLPSACAASLQAYLGLLGVAYEREHCASPLSSPSGALPCLAFDDEPVGDALLARRGSLDELGGAPGSLVHCAAAVADLDAPLPPAERAEAAAFAALVDDILSTATLSATWVDEKAFSTHTRVAFGRCLPPVAAAVETQRWRAAVAAHVASHSAGAAAAVTSAAAALSLFSARLAKSEASGGSFLLGSLPSSADAALLAQLAFVLHAPPLASSPLRERLLDREHRSLVTYLNAHLAGTACAGRLFGATLAGGAVRPGAPAPLRRPIHPAATAGEEDASAATSGGAWSLSEHRKSQLAVGFALASCAVYAVSNDLVEIRFEEEDEAEAEEAEDEVLIDDDEPDE